MQEFGKTGKDISVEYDSDMRLAKRTLTACINRVEEEFDETGLITLESIRKTQEARKLILDALATGETPDNITVTQVLQPHQPNQVEVETLREYNSVLFVAHVAVLGVVGIDMPKGLIDQAVYEIGTHEKAHKDILDATEGVTEARYRVSFYTNKKKQSPIFVPDITWAGTIKLPALIKAFGNPVDPSPTDKMISTIPLYK